MTELLPDEMEMYMDAMKEFPTPFERYVSRGDTPDYFDVPEPRLEAERNIERALKSCLYDGTSRFVPIIGTAGSGKTHLYWVLKDKEEQEGENPRWHAVYVPSPPAPVRILLHVWTAILDEIGEKMLRAVSTYLLTEFGKKKGIFQRIDPDETIRVASREFPGIGADIVKALIFLGFHYLDTGKKEYRERGQLAERWLLGESLTEEQMAKLGVQTIIEDDDMVLSSMKILLQLYDKALVLYFDELEIPYRTHGSEAEIAFLEVLKRLYNELPKTIIVAACLKDIWSRIYDSLDPAMKSRMEEVVELKPFSKENLILLYEEAMTYYWEHVVNVESPPDPLFPMKKEYFDFIHEKSKGNPRESIKLIRRFLDLILDHGLRADIPKLYLQESTVPVISTRPLSRATTSTGTSFSRPATSSTVSTMPMGESSTGQPPMEQQGEIEEILEENMTIQVNPPSVASGVVNSILAAADALGKPIQATLDYKFKVGNSEKKLSALIVLEDGKKIAVDVPSVKNFDRKGGVAAYYSLKRLDAAIKNAVADQAILIVPKHTSGTKFLKLVEDLGDKLKKYEINDKIGKELIIGGITKNLSPLGRKIAHDLIPEFPEKEPEEVIPGPSNGEMESSS